MDDKSISHILDESEKKFTIAQPAYDKLESTVKGIGNFITNNNSKIKIYFQGSFAYGTIIRPYNKDADGDYDVDIVVEYPSDVNYTAYELKKKVGDCLKKSPYNVRLNEGKRCWTLDYADTTDSTLAFHLDILPSISNGQNQNDLKKTEIKITTRDKQNPSDYKWSYSNPKGYRKWLGSIDDAHCGSSTAKPASSIVSDLNKVSDPISCTPLRSAVKILKRSRDVFFATRADSEYRPISIIITTIVAKTIDADGTHYNNVVPVLDKVINHLCDMKPENNGKWEFVNPVDIKENFADKWNNDPKYAKAFYDWAKYLKSQWDTIKKSNEVDAKHLIEDLLGLKKDSLQNVKIEGPKPVTNASKTPKSYA